MIVAPRFSIASLEPAIISRTALDDGQTPFHYLLGAWKRAVELSRSIRPDRDKQANEKNKILTEIRRLCVSYAGLSLMMPDMFG
jgi:ubiquitin conjugation factor E4 B